MDMNPRLAWLFFVLISPSLARDGSVPASTNGTIWQWQVSRAGPGSDRVFFFFETERTPPRNSERWEIQMLPHEVPDRAATVRWRRMPTGKPETTYPLSVDWYTVAPLPLLPQPAEQVDCRVKLPTFNAPLRGLCAAAPGGPLGVPPGPIWIQVDKDPQAAELQLTSGLISLVSGGLVIPDATPRDEVAKLESYVAPGYSRPDSRIQNSIRAFWKNPTQPALSPLMPTPGRISLESATTLVSGLTGDALLLGISLLIPLLPEPQERWVVARVAFKIQQSPLERIRLASALRKWLKSADACDSCALLRTQALAALPPNEAQGVEELWSQRAPALEQMANAHLEPPFGRRSRARWLTQLAGHTRLSETEARILIEPFLPFSEEEFLKVALPRMDSTQRIGFLLDRLEAPESRVQVSFLTTQLPILTLIANSSALRTRLLKSAQWDDRRAALGEAMLTTATPENRGAIEQATLRSFQFDEARLHWIQRHAEWVAALSQAERIHVLALFDFSKEEARKALGISER